MHAHLLEPGLAAKSSRNVLGMDSYNAREYHPVVGIFLPATMQGTGRDFIPAPVNNPETLADPTGQRLCYG